MLNSLKKVLQPAASPQSTPVFKLEEFKTQQLPGQENPAWMVSLSSSVDIQASYYTLQATVRSASGAVLQTGASIAIPTSAKNQIRHMTQPYQKTKEAKTIQFTVLRYDGQAVVTKAFDLPTVEGVLAGAQPNLPQQIAETGSKDLTERVSVTFNDQGDLVIQNQGNMSFKCDVRVVAEFAAGANKRIGLSCPSALTMAPGSSNTGTLQNTKDYLECPTLLAFRAVVTSNKGARYEAVRSFDPGDLLIIQPKITNLTAQVSYMDEAFVDYKFRLMMPEASVRRGTLLVVNYVAEVLGKWKLEKKFGLVMDDKGYVDIEGSEYFGGLNLESKTLDIKLISITTKEKLCCGNTSLPVCNDYTAGRITIGPRPK